MRLIVFSDITVDGFMTGPENEHLDFMVSDPQLQDQLMATGGVLVGRRTFDLAGRWGGGPPRRTHLRPDPSRAR